MSPSRNSCGSVFTPASVIPCAQHRLPIVGPPTRLLILQEAMKKKLAGGSSGGELPAGRPIKDAIDLELEELRYSAVLGTLLQVYTAHCPRPFLAMSCSPVHTVDLRYAWVPQEEGQGAVRAARQAVIERRVSFM